MLHRDVKPSNVLITGDGEAVLTDFGIATVDGDPSLTQDEMMMGTPAYLAPERIRGEAAAARGMWSLGATGPRRMRWHSFRHPQGVRGRHGGQVHADLGSLLRVRCGTRSGR